MVKMRFIQSALYLAFSTPTLRRRSERVGARAKRLFWRGVGWTLFAIGLAGLVLPLLPTTIFWILAVLALGKADPELARRIRAWPQVGPAVADFLDHGVIAPRGKLAALIGLGAGAVAANFLIGPGPWLIGVLAVMAAVALYVLSRRSYAPGSPRRAGAAPGTSDSTSPHPHG